MKHASREQRIERSKRVIRAKLALTQKKGPHAVVEAFAAARALRSFARKMRRWSAQTVGYYNDADVTCDIAYRYVASEADARAAKIERGLK